jgi:competence ComEA-like helix-hairpin-helix protein
MRFPFFKGTQNEPKPTTRAPIPVRRAKLADTQPLQRLPVLPGSLTPPPPAATPAAEEPSVNLNVASLVQQLPQQLFTDDGRAQLASVTLAVPVGLLLPQLSSGRISVKLDDLIPLFPANILRSPLPPISDQQSVVLPLHEVIAAIPPELLAVEHDSEISADDDALESIPALIDEAMMSQARAARIEKESASKPTPAEANAEPEPGTIVVPPKLKTNDSPEYVMVSLRALVAVMPDAVFCCPRPQLPTKVNLDTPVLLPTDPIIPQLRSAHVKLPLSIIIAMIPHQILANPMPVLDGQPIPIPLAEIIPQLPKNLFTDYLREPSEETAVASDEFPDPFQEKSAIQEAPAAEVPAEPFVFEDAALADENFSIFTERTTAAPAEPATLEPVEPVAEAPAPEPIAEPVAEVAPVIEPTPAPVVEPVAQVAPLVEPTPEPVAQAPATPAIEPEPAVVEPVAEPAAELPAPVEAIAAPVFEPIAEPEPVVETVAEVAAVVAPVAEVVRPVVTPEPTAAEAHEEFPATATQAFDEKKLIVDLNRCSVEDLVTIPGVGRALAQRIIDFRSVRGQFHSVEELRQVPGIGRKTFRALAGIQPRALNRLLGAPHDGELTLQEIVRLASKLQGIDGCMLATSDGLFLTGELPSHLDQSTISVFAPQLFKKVGRYARELKVGSIRRFTIFTDTQPISIFRAGDVYLIVIHDAFRFSKALMRRCERISQEIARLSSQRVTV